MGIFRKIKRTIKGTGKAVGGGLDLLSATFSHPLTATKGYTQLLTGKKKKGAKTLYGITKKTKNEGAVKTISRTVRTTALASAVLLGGGTAVGRTILAKAVVPKSIGGLAKIPIVITGGTVLFKSKKARKVVDTFTDPTTAIRGGEIIAETIETGKPGVSVKEAVVGGGLLAGAVVGGLAIVKGSQILPDLLPDKQLIKEKPLGIEGETPITPQTATITTGKKKYKRRKVKKSPSVRQSVRVNIINRPTNTGLRITNKRYLNKELLC